MSSGAIHNVALFSRFMPSGLLFVPSIGGVSHSVDEDTSEEDLITGCQVMADAAAELITLTS